MYIALLNMVVVHLFGEQAWPGQFPITMTEETLAFLWHGRPSKSVCNAQW